MSRVWETRPIADVAFIQEGPGIRKYEYEEGGYPMINVRCVQDGYIDMNSARAANRNLAEGKWSHFQIDAGDILFTTSGTIGRCAIVKDDDLPLLMNTSVVRFKPTYVNLDRDYLYYFLQSDGFQTPLLALSSGTAIRNVGPTHIKTLSIPLPPLEEQKRIVAVLDQAFAALDRARALAEANLADAEELFERQLAEQFANAGDQVGSIPFAQLCTALTPKAKIQRKDYLEAGAFPIVSQEADLISGYWNDRSALMGLTKPVVVFGDHTRCLKYIDFDFVVGADGTKVLLPKSGIDPLYLYYGLRSVPLTEKGYARHFKFLKELSLPKLELSEQGRVSLALRSLEDEVTRLSAAYYDKLSELADLRQSLLQKAFAGELT